MRLNLLLIRLYNLLLQNKKGLVFYPFVIYWILIFILTSIPAEGLPTFGIGDKFEHLFAYFFLGILMQLSFHFQNRSELLKRRNAFYTFIISIGYGIFDEAHQYLIPGRYCDMLDLLANILGTSAAVAVTVYFLKTADRLKDSTS